MRLKSMFAFGLAVSSVLATTYIYADTMDDAEVSLAEFQENSTSRAAANLIDDDLSTYWGSRSQVNDINFLFTGDSPSQCLTSFQLDNYGDSNRSVKDFMLLSTTDSSLSADAGVTGWRPIASDLNPSTDIDYLSWAQGARLQSVDSQYNATSSAAEHINNGDVTDLWRSRKSNNIIEYAFDTDWNGSVGDSISINSIQLTNYGNNDRSVKDFQIEYTLNGVDWQKLEVPSSVAGDSDFNFARYQNGGVIGLIDSQYNSTSSGADNLADGDTNTRWRSRYGNNTIEFTFDPNGNGTTGADGDVDDVFNLESFVIENYGTDDRSVREFQIEVRTLTDSNWQKLNVPGGTVGDPNFNFTSSQHGGELVLIDSQHNATSSGADNIHDGDSNSLWRSTKGNNELAFQFDVNEDGVAATDDDLFSFDRFYLQNYGNDDRSIREFQVAVKTKSNPTWQKLKVPGAMIGGEDFDFTLSFNGGVLTNIDSQHNAGSSGADNIHDGDTNSFWRSRKGNNTLDFQFDVDGDGSTSQAGDLFEINSFEIINYGNDDRSIREFQVEVRTVANPNWSKIPVSGSGAGAPGHNFALSQSGGALTLIDSQHNAGSSGADNIHDGDQNTYWRSRNQVNTLEFAFDTDYDGVSGDVINVDTIELINYGNDDRSIASFEIDVQISGGAWQPLQNLDGDITYSAAMNSNTQSWGIAPTSNITAIRFRTLTNHGDRSYTGAREIRFLGTSVGPSYIFTADMNTSVQSYDIDESDRPVDITDVRLRTISNHGDRSYIGAREFRVLGPAITESVTFEAAMNSNGETFVLDAEDVPVDVTDVKLITINNHGDRSYVGAREFQVLGNSITRPVTFTAEMNRSRQVFELDVDDIPVAVTEIRLVTINNHGDVSYTGIQEIEFIGKSVTPSTTFTVDMTGIPQTIVLDPEDRVTGVVGARLLTISNHGDVSYTGLADLKLFGTPTTPSYIFTADRIADMQQFDFEPTTSKIMRFHTMSNHGNYSTTRAKEINVLTGICKSGQWRFDEPSWNGSANEVQDSSGGAFDGTVQGFALGTAPATATESPAIDTDPGTCSYGTFDGIDDFVSIAEGDRFDELTEFTVTAWIKVDDFSASSNSGVFSKGPMIDGEVSYGAFFGPTAADSNNLQIDVIGSDNRFSSTTSFDEGTWYHIALVFNGSKAESERVELYVNGVIDGVFAETSNEIPDGSDDFYIANFVSSLSSNQLLQGQVDEVNIQPVAMTSAEINALMMSTRSCTPPLHHIRLEHDGSALTCSAETVTVKACADADCSTLVNTSVDVMLSSTSGNSVWSSDMVTIPASTPLEVTLSNPVAEIVEISATPSIPAMMSTQCTPDCNVDFADSGFIVSMPNHQSCSTSSLSIRAVKLSDNSMSCAPAYTGEQAVDFTFSYNQPFSGSTIPVLAGDVMAASGVPQSRTITFDSNGEVILDFEYRDAGQIIIDVADGAGAGLTTGSTTTVVTPAKLIVSSNDVNSQCAAGDASCSVFTSAGTPFALSVAAACADNTVTPNFQMNNIPLTVNTVAPTTGHPVSLGVSSVSIVDADNGVNIEPNQSISEVGIFTITATPPVGSYFGETIPAATSDNLGRFTPSHFRLEKTLDGILGSGQPFVYTGQTQAGSSAGQLTLSVPSEFSIFASNAGGSVTKNYTGSFNKLIAPNVAIVTPTEDTSQLGQDGITNVTLTSNITPGSLSGTDGELTYLFDANSNFVYPRTINNKVAPFVSDITLAVSSIVDSDGIAALDVDANTSNGVIAFSPVGEEVRFGRIFLNNSYGREDQDTNLVLNAEHWNGSTFVANLADSFTAFNATVDTRIVDISLAPATTSIQAINPEQFASGLATLTLASPGLGNQGEIAIQMDVPDWLRYDWENLDNAFDGPFDDDPGAVVSFGVYRGNDRTIHWREVFE